MTRLVTCSRRVAVALLAALSGCGADPDLSLLEGEPNDWAERRRRLDITVIEHDPELGALPPEQYEPDDLIPLVVHTCVGTVRGDASNTFDECSGADALERITSTAANADCTSSIGAMCSAQIGFCAAQLYLELASGVMPVDLYDDSSTRFTVPVQSTATRAGLAEAAKDYATYAAVMAGESLRRFAGDGDATVAVCNSVSDPVVAGDDTLTYGEEFAHLLLESLRAAREATDLAVEYNVAVADNDYSRIPDRGLAARTEWMAPVLSRFHALGLLVGQGEYYAHTASDTHSFNRESLPFAQTHFGAECDGRCLEALRVVRATAIRTDDLLEFADPGGTPFWLDEVRGRLAERTASPSLAAQTSDEFAATFGLTVADFTRAREYLLVESVVFDREGFYSAPSRILPTSDGEVRYSAYTDYRGARRPPDPLPPAVHIVSSRGFSEGGAGMPPTPAPSPSYADTSLLHLTDYVENVARMATRSALVPTSVKEVLAPTVAVGEANLTARLLACWQSDAAQNDLMFAVLGRSDGSALRLVGGVAGVRCATTGELEGEPCDLSSHIIDTSFDGPFSSSEYSGFDEFVTLSVSDAEASSFPSLTSHSFHVFVVEPRPGVVDPVAGDYAVIGGLGMPRSDLRAVRAPSFDPGEFTTCEVNPVNHELDEAISVVADRDPKDVSAPHTDCTLERPELIPLEDVLIDDGSAAENSFRYHLNIARQAADEADQLGEMLINAGLTIDERAEASLESVESMCGARLNVDGLFGALGGGPGSDIGLTPMYGGGCPCGTGYECVGGACIIDLGVIGDSAAEPSYDTRVLAECLGLGEDGEGEIVDIVALGSRELCVQRNPSSDNILCDDPSDRGCPYFLDQTAESEEEEECDSGDFTVEEENTLGLIPARAVSSVLIGLGDEPGANLCNEIRAVRRMSPTAPGRPAAVQRIIDNNFFAFENVHYWAQRMGWRASPLSYSELTLDGSEWYGTGQPFDEWAVAGDEDSDHEPGERPVGPSPGWPCALEFFPGRAAEDCTGDTASLFCSTVDCGDPYERALMNERLGRASILLAVTSGMGINNLRLPAYFASHFDTSVSLPGTYRASGDGINWSIGREAEFDPTGTAGNNTLVGLFATPAESRDLWIANGTPFVGTEASPVFFAGFGVDEFDDRARAQNNARMFWEGMSRGDVPSFDLPELDYVIVDPGCVVNVFADALSGTVTQLGGRHNCGSSWSYLGLSNVYWSGRAQRMQWDGLGHETNALRILGSGDAGAFTASDAFDALELMCESAAYVEAGGPTCDPDRPPAVNGREDLPALRAYLGCLADRLETIGERVVIQDIPRSLVVALRGETTAIRPDEGGYGAEVTRLRTSLRDITEIPEGIANTLRQIASAIELVETELAAVELRTEIGDLSTASSAASQLSACASSGTAWSAVATCANAALQIGFAIRINELEGEVLRGEASTAMTQFRDRFDAAQLTLGQLGRSLMDARDNVNASLSNLRTMRLRVRRDLADALVLSADDSGTHYAVNTVVRRRYNTLRRRYEVARRAAIRMAALARTALEQRLGVDLSTITAPDGGWSLVDAPPTWADSLCETTGMDYTEIRDTSGEGMDHYADAYIGDYIRNLERFFESYRLDFPYFDGSATAVISVRDDVSHVREACYWESYNLIATSNDLTCEFETSADGGCPLASLPGEDPIVAWEQLGCLEPDEETLEACVAVLPIGDAPGLGISFRTPPAAFRMIFASGTDGMGTEDVTYTEDAEWSQTVEVAAGLYRLSWWARDVDAPTGHTGDLVELRSTTAGTLSSNTTPLSPIATVDGWERYVRFYDVPRSGEVRVAIVPADMMGDPLEQMYDVAAIQFERADDRIVEPATTIDDTDLTTVPEFYEPRPFGYTSTRGVSIRVAKCEDTDGSSFRTSEHWRPFCENVCTSRTDCEERCGWETDPIVINPATAFGSGDSPFARAPGITGNFNHRIETIALNFVGTGTRICDDPSRPSSCYTSAFIPYSIIHEPPYSVIDWYGATSYESPIFEGRINFAPGLAAERYITNPVSSADQALLASYTRTELRGRPLAGRIRIRVWDNGEVNFAGIEDVQVVLGYRYLTRTGAPAARP
jgi:hypothetical protein